MVWVGGEGEGLGVDGGRRGGGVGDALGDILAKSGII